MHIEHAYLTRCLASRNKIRSHYEKFIVAAQDINCSERFINTRICHELSVDST